MGWNLKLGQFCFIFAFLAIALANVSFAGYYSDTYGWIRACGEYNAGPCQCYNLVCKPGQSCNTDNGIKCIPETVTCPSGQYYSDLYGCIKSCGDTNNVGPCQCSNLVCKTGELCNAANGGQCTKAGCAYGNPACAANQYCDTSSNADGVCKAKVGCAYGNPTCTATQYCDTSTNADGVCKTKAGCAYGNPTCAVNQYCDTSTNVDGVCTAKVIACDGYTDVAYGKTISAGNYNVRLDELATVGLTSNGYPAVFGILDSNGNEIAQRQVSAGNSYTYTANSGEKINIDVCKTVQGSSSNIADAWVKTTYTAAPVTTCPYGQYYSSQYGCISACGDYNAGPCQCYDKVCGPGYNCNTQSGVQCIIAGTDPTHQPTSTVGSDLASRPVRGSNSAKLTIVEYSDFLCPFCVNAQSTMTQILNDYNGKVKLIDMAYPIHGDAANLAAQAAECANDQGMFWQYFDQLYSSQKTDASSLKQQAASLGLNTAKFNSCLDNNLDSGRVNAMQNIGKQAGVPGTPTFILMYNDGARTAQQTIVGAQDYAAFKTAVDKLLGTSSGYGTCYDGQKGPCANPNGGICTSSQYYSSQYGCIASCGNYNSGACQCYNLVCAPGQTCNTDDGLDHVKCITPGIQVNTCPGYTILGIYGVTGQIVAGAQQELSAGSFKVHLTNIYPPTSSRNNNHPAVLSILDMNNNVLGQAIVNMGETYTFTAQTGETLTIQVCQTDPGPPLADEWASVKLTYNSGVSGYACPGYTKLMIGQSTASTSGAFSVRLADISVATGVNNNHPAILDVLDANGAVIGQVQVSAGTTYTFTQSSTGNQVQIQVCQTNSGTTLDYKWAYVKVTDSGTVSNVCPGFSKMVAVGYPHEFDQGPLDKQFYVIYKGNAPNTRNAIFDVYYQEMYNKMASDIQIGAGGSQIVTNYKSGNYATIQVCKTDGDGTSGSAWVNVVYNDGTVSNVCPGYTPLSLYSMNWQSLSAGTFYVRLSDVNGQGSTSTANLQILDSNGRTVGQAYVGTGGSFTFTSTSGETLLINVCQAVGNTDSASSRLAYVKLTYTASTTTSPPAFPTSSTSWSLNLHKGWNLVSMNGKPNSFDASAMNSKIVGFVYIKSQEKYVSMLEAQRMLGSGFADYLAKNPFWAYSYSEQTLKASVSPSTTSGYSLLSGWNVVPISSAITGKGLADISNNCNVASAYAWNPNTQNWDAIGSGYRFSSSDINGGMIVNVNNACTFAP